MSSPEPQFNEVPIHELPGEKLSQSRFLLPGCLSALILSAGGLVLCVMPEALLTVFLLLFGLALLLLEFAFGWVAFLHSNLSQMQPSRAEVVFSLIVAVLFAGTLHATARSFYRKTGRWRVKWTVGLLVMAAVLFGIGTATAGIGRQLVSLAELPLWIYDVNALPRRNVRANHLKGIGLALHNYHDAAGQFPPGGTFDPWGRPMHSWMTSLLPYLDEQPLYDRIRHDLPWNAPENQSPFRTQLDVLLFPLHERARSHNPEGYALTNYAANVYLLGPNRGLTFSEVTDGLSNTIAVGEAAANPRAWGDPRNWRDPALGINASPYSFGGPRGSTGCYMLFCDGTAHFLSEKIDPAILRKLATPNGGEQVNAADF